MLIEEHTNKIERLVSLERKQLKYKILDNDFLDFSKLTIN